MFDPGIGRWLQEDPIGFDAGDANLYRYVSNGPLAGVDPSGMLYASARDGWSEQARELLDRTAIANSLYRVLPVPGAPAWQTLVTLRQDQRIGGGFYAKVHFMNFYVPRPGEGRIIDPWEVATHIVVRERLIAALDRMKKALFVITEREPWERARRELGATPRAGFLFQGDNWRFYRDAIRSVIRTAEDAEKVINFRINPRGGEPGVPAFVWTVRGFWISDVIDINPLFFGRGENLEVGTMVHELGRLIPHITSDDLQVENSTNNILTWDAIINGISSNYAQFRGPP